MLLLLMKEFMICFGSTLPFLLLFEIPILIRCRNTKGRVFLPHFVSNLFFVWLLTIMLDLTGIPSIRLLSGYGIITDHGLIMLRKCFSAICTKIKSSKEQESQIFLLRHEALFDILAAFMGMFLLYNPFL